MLLELIEYKLKVHPNDIDGFAHPPLYFKRGINMEVKILSGIGMIIFGILYITFKRIEIKSEEQIKERMYIHNRNVMLGITDKEYKFSDDIFQKSNFTKMNNTGSIPEEEIDIAYKTFAGNETLSLNQDGDKPQILDKELSPLINSIWKTIETGIKTMVNSSSNIEQGKKKKAIV